MRTNTVALVVSLKEGHPVWLDTLSNEDEIISMEAALQDGSSQPLSTLYQRRAELQQREFEFENYIEELLCQPFLHPRVQKHGVEWFKSRIRIENIEKIEREAAQVIGQFAFRIYENDHSQTDFTLAGSTSQVRVRIFALSERADSP